jgi:hypothetical protein
LVVLQPQLYLDLEPEYRSQRAKKQDEMVQQGLEDFYPADLLEGVRHDFDNMNIVDDVEAQELDDGFRFKGYLLNLVTFGYTPAHAFAIEALKRQETAYFFRPLFLRSLMYSPIHGLSLGSKQGEGAPDRVCYPFGRVPFAEGEQSTSPLTGGEIRDSHDLLSFVKASILRQGKNDSYQIIEERFLSTGYWVKCPKAC